MEKLDKDGNEELSVEECEAALAGWRKDQGTLPFKDAYRSLRRLSKEDCQTLSRTID